jgi:hypothetical protein
MDIVSPILKIAFNMLLAAAIVLSILHVGPSLVNNPDSLVDGISGRMISITILLRIGFCAVCSPVFFSTFNFQTERRNTRKQEGTAVRCNFRSRIECFFLCGCLRASFNIVYTGRLGEPVCQDSCFDTECGLFFILSCRAFICAGSPRFPNRYE